MSIKTKLYTLLKPNESLKACCLVTTDQYIEYEKTIAEPFRIKNYYYYNIPLFHEGQEYDKNRDIIDFRKIQSENEWYKAVNEYLDLRLQSKNELTYA